MQTRHGQHADKTCRVLGDASWMRGKVSKARMRLVTSRCQRIRAPGSNTPRGKMAAASSFCHTAHAHSHSAFSPYKVDGTRRKIYGMLQLAFHKVQYTRPGLACSPGSAKSGCWAPQADRRDYKMCRDVSGRAVSKDRGSVVRRSLNLSMTS